MLRKFSHVGKLYLQNELKRYFFTPDVSLPIFT